MAQLSQVSQVSQVSWDANPGNLEIQKTREILTNFSDGFSQVSTFPRVFEEFPRIWWIWWILLVQKGQNFQ